MNLSLISCETVRPIVINKEIPSPPEYPSDMNITLDNDNFIFDRESMIKLTTWKIDVESYFDKYM